ncbi:MAG: nucleoside triphosphate pyrophosphohydrolase family protein [Saprospiraceae bacterium]|nr:nucleoside triphosphate pyrophosphohydrolase family protein [Saprospiraceae bacterium]
MKKFKEPRALTAVAAFHHLFDMPVVDDPAIPSSDRCRLRINLIEEELKELKDAISKGNIVDAADALADLQYVLSGAILEFGLGERFKSLFDEVQRSNMSKACQSFADAEETMRHYKKIQGVDSEIVEKDGCYLVFRLSDRKVLKSVKYSEADLAKIVVDQGIIE